MHNTTPLYTILHIYTIQTLYTIQHTIHYTDPEEDVHNRFSHYAHLGHDTTHTIRVPGYIEDFRIDLKALLTTKVRVACGVYAVDCVCSVYCVCVFEDCVR